MPPAAAAVDAERRQSRDERRAQANLDNALHKIDELHKNYEALQASASANKVTNVEQQVKEVKCELNDVIGFDIVMSTGEGKPKPTDARTTVFKRDLEEKYSV